MAIFLMISGSFYMAMPLTAAASTFYTVHERYNERHSDPEEIAGQKVLAASNSDTPGNSDNDVKSESKSNESTAVTAAPKPPPSLIADQRLQLSVRYSITELKQKEEDLQQLVSELVTIPNIFVNDSKGGGGGRGTGRGVSVREQKNASDFEEEDGDPNDPIWQMRRDVMHQTRVLDDTIGNCERDIVE